MRTSAHSIKTKVKSRLQTVPQEGTLTRKYFDIALKGEWFDLLDIPFASRAGIMAGLKDRYEMEFIRRAHPNRDPSKRALRQYKCLGIWDDTKLMSVEDVEAALNEQVKGTD